MGNLVVLALMTLTAFLVAAAVKSSHEEIRIEGGQILWFVEGNLKATVNGFDELYKVRNGRV